MRDECRISSGHLYLLAVLLKSLFGELGKQYKLQPTPLNRLLSCLAVQGLRNRG